MSGHSDLERSSVPCSTPHGAQLKKVSEGLADRWPAIFPHEEGKSPYELLP